ncbi:GrpB family protein [Deinococcus wulumuqiensis]|nr:GrpB family protein [Deinococcus wulumuqiensis]
MQLVSSKDIEWKRRYHAHYVRLTEIWPNAYVEHIGSTAIGGIQSKDVVDILVGVQPMDIEITSSQLINAGYMKEGARAGHIWLCWPNPESRDSVVHVVEMNGAQWQARLAFRDALRANPVLAKEYESLKIAIAQTTDDWGEYTQNKAQFVTTVLKNVTRG